jgi:hypothetical protein
VHLMSLQSAVKVKKLHTRPSVRVRNTEEHGGGDEVDKERFDLHSEVQGRFTSLRELEREMGAVLYLKIELIIEPRIRDTRKGQ